MTYFISNILSSSTTGVKSFVGGSSLSSSSFFESGSKLIGLAAIRLRLKGAGDDSNVVFTSTKKKNFNCS